MKQQQVVKILYGGVAALLILCLFDMPYGFYNLVRFVAAAAFCYLAYISFTRKSIDRMVVFIALALLFQPFAKIALGRVIWNIVDIIVAIYLIYLLWSDKCGKKSKTFRTDSRNKQQISRDRQKLT